MILVGSEKYYFKGHERKCRSEMILLAHFSLVLIINLADFFSKFKIIEGA